MLKYANTDISDGFKLINAGINNIIASLLLGKIEKYELNSSLNYYIIVGIISEIFPFYNHYYKDNSMIVSIDNKFIIITFEQNKTTFSINT